MKWVGGIMTKVYPNAAAAAAISPLPHPHPPVADAASINYAASKADPTATVVLTVWKKSLLFNCNGFTVFDAQGNLVYRVDSYMSGGKTDDIFLMDAFGNSLLTIRRRKRLSLQGDSWLVFDGEMTENPRFLVMKNVTLLNAKGGVVAQVSSCLGRMTKTYEIEGNYAQRCCTVYDDKRRRVAEIKQKEASIKGVAFGTDIFRLVVHDHDGFESSAAMAMVIILDRLFGSSSTSPRRLLTNC